MRILDVMFITAVLIGPFLFNLYRLGSKVVHLSVLTFFKKLLDLTQLKNNKIKHLKSVVHSFTESRNV